MTKEAIQIMIDFADLETLTGLIAQMDMARANPTHPKEFSETCEQAYAQIIKIAGPFANELSIADDENNPHNTTATQVTPFEKVH